MTMKFGFGFTEVQIRFVFDDRYVFIKNFFMKSYLVGTHYKHLVDKILICTHSNSLCEEMSKEFSDSFYCMSFILGDRLTKDSKDSPGKKKTTTDPNVL